MDFDELKYRVRTLLSRRGGGGGESVNKIKVIALSAVLGLLLLWLAIQVVPMLVPEGRAKKLDTRGWRTAEEINAVLAEQVEFNDTGVNVVSESPLSFQVVGAVRSQEAVNELRAFVAERYPDAEFTIEVEVMDHGGH